MDKDYLRQQSRQRRRSLSKTQQLKAQKQLASIVCALPEFHESIHIALYVAHDGEINPADITQQIWYQNKACYLPAIDQNCKGAMHFLPHYPDTLMKTNQYGTTEPLLIETNIFCAKKLDLVLMPLTCFNTKGHRIGMGGGYYDRAFAFKQNTSRSKKPILIGLAHACQNTKILPTDNWDIKLDGIATDEQFYRTSNTHNK